MESIPKNVMGAKVAYDVLLPLLQRIVLMGTLVIRIEASALPLTFIVFIFFLIDLRLAIIIGFGDGSYTPDGF